MGLKIFNGSGGGTKIVGLYQAYKALYENGYRPDIITGVSASAYLAVPLAMQLFDEIEDMLSKMTLDTIFNKKPVNEKGKITLGAIARVIGGDYALGDQRKSLDLLRTIITPERFEHFKFAKSLPSKVSPFISRVLYPDVYIFSVDFRTGANNLVNVKELGYEEFLEQTLGSGSIPIFTRGVQTTRFNSSNGLRNGLGLLFDGGIRHHIASTVLLDKVLDSKLEVEQVVSVYARPQDYHIDEADDWMPSDISTSFERTFDIMSMQISKSDEQTENLMAKVHGFKLNQVFLPDILEGTYDTNKDRLVRYGEESYKLAKQVKL